MYLFNELFIFILNINIIYSIGSEIMDKEYFFVTDQLVIWRPTGTLISENILEFISFLNKYSEKNDPHFNRLIDLTHLSGISVQYKDLYPIAEQRKEYFNVELKQKVKMVFLVNNPVTYGMARMYQMLTNNPHLVANICKTIEEAAQFLDLDVSVISP